MKNVVTKHIDSKVNRWVHFLWCSDVHLGSVRCALEELEADFKAARQVGARINFIGDLFDAIVWQDRKRYNPQEVIPDLRDSGALLNDVVNHAFEILAPYADLIDIVGYGNHEWAVRQHHSHDLIQVLVHRLNTECNPPDEIKIGGWCGAICYKFSRAELNAFWFHGYGTNAPVTKGMIDINRIRTWIHGFDLVVYGHKHHSLTNHSQYVAKEGDSLIVKPSLAVQAGTYMQTFQLEPSDNDTLPSLSYSERKMHEPVMAGNTGWVKARERPATWNAAKWMVYATPGDRYDAEDAAS